MDYLFSNIQININNILVSIFSHKYLYNIKESNWTFILSIVTNNTLILNMHLERRVIYCYSDYECDNLSQTINTIIGVSISILFLSLIFSAYFHMNKEKKPQPSRSPVTLDALAPVNTNGQSKAEENNQNSLPHYNNGSQEAQVSPNNPQNSSLPYYNASPQDINSDQPHGYFTGGFTPPNSSQLNANQSYPPNLNI
jgi:hypothetical protein